MEAVGRQGTRQCQKRACVRDRQCQAPALYNPHCPSETASRRAAMRGHLVSCPDIEYCITIYFLKSEMYLKYCKRTRTNF